MSDLCLSFSYIKSFLPLTDPWDACLSCWYWKLPASSSCWLLFWDLKEKLFFAPLSFSLSFYQLSSFGLVSMYISLFQFSAFHSSETLTVQEVKEESLFPWGSLGFHGTYVRVIFIYTWYCIDLCINLANKQRSLNQVYKICIFCSFVYCDSN